ncbi:MAG: hypothetical protein WCY26_01165 [Thiohalobacteraceae bacterium]|nr:hypothetical protein [Gammaproteobacteria bacterium]
MSNPYYEAIDKMEKAGVDRDYIVGWAGAYNQNPPREEQRASDAYTAGYEKGKARDASGFEAWVKK